jgi:hypothetical protein
VGDRKQGVGDREKRTEKSAQGTPVSSLLCQRPDLRVTGFLAPVPVPLLPSTPVSCVLCCVPCPPIPYLLLPPSSRLLPSGDVSQQVGHLLNIDLLFQIGRHR